MSAFATVHESCAHRRLSELFLVSKAAILLASATGRDLWQWSKKEPVYIGNENEISMPLIQMAATNKNNFA